MDGDSVAVGAIVLALVFSVTVVLFTVSLVVVAVLRLRFSGLLCFCVLCTTSYLQEVILKKANHCFKY